MTAEILLARRSRGDGDLGAPEKVAEARFGVGEVLSPAGFREAEGRFSVAEPFAGWRRIRRP